MFFYIEIYIARPYSFSFPLFLCNTNTLLYSTHWDEIYTLASKRWYWGTFLADRWMLIGFLSWSYTADTDNLKLERSRRQPANSRRYELGSNRHNECFRMHNSLLTPQSCQSSLLLSTLHRNRFRFSFFKILALLRNGFLFFMFLWTAIIYLFHYSSNCIRTNSTIFRWRYW